jgi:hypothetical protein
MRSPHPHRRPRGSLPRLVAEYPAATRIVDQEVRREVELDSVDKTNAMGQDPARQRFVARLRRWLSAR